MNRILERINSPQDLKALPFRELEKLAAEIRELVIRTVSQTGGHLAPNLGVVELTLALHRVFDAPEDKIIWDVGHQCYVHKIITGRRDRLETLRQFEGLSGFPCRNESPYDAFGTGHSSTAISAALGMAVARDLSGRNFSVVAVVGDGALTAGMAFEALNHAGHLQIPLVVVLNDNEMSIAKNVGALAGYLARIRSDPRYFRSKEEFESLVGRIPAVGPKMVKLAERLRDSLKYLVVPGMFFEELGFTYLGPIDGHHLGVMTTVLEQAKMMKNPVLVHVITRKGMGYEPAEKNPDVYHGIGPFDVVTGKPKKDGRLTYTEVFGQTLVQLAADNPRVVAITAAMPAGTGLVAFSRTYPDRFFDVGIAEQHAVTFAAGLATEGYKPVVAIYSTFLQRAFDQVLHDVCLQKLPVVFALDRGGIVGDDGATHQGLFDLAYLRIIPNIVVMAPKDENELRHMLKTALDFDGPIAFRYPRGTGTGCPIEQEIRSLPIGVAEVLRDGEDIAVLAVGNTVSTALEAAQELGKRGISAAVINARFVKPLDEACIVSYATRTRKVITLEENVLAGGFGSAVLELLNDRGLGDVKLARLGIPDVFVEHGTPEILRAKYGLTAAGVVRTAETLLQKAKKFKLVTPGWGEKRR
ncbi:MAG: 1-deoxy-D-xylulose-5-phosphate synthase [Desulfotomaculales bacterium]